MTAIRFWTMVAVLTDCHGLSGELEQWADIGRKEHEVERFFFVR